MPIDLLGWVVGKRGSDLIARIPGKELRVKVRISNSGSVRMIEDDVLRGAEVLVKMRVQNLDGGVVTASSIKVLHRGRSPAPYDFIDPSKPREFARHSYVALRLPRYQKILRVQHIMLKSLRRFLDERGFTELLPPVISTASDPGLRGAGTLKTKLYGETYEVLSSTIMFRQIAATALEKIYFITRNVREEPPENAATWRHLVEFTQLNVEWAGASMDDVMKLAEELVYKVCIDVLADAGDIIREFNPGIKCPTPPFKRLTYREAIKLAERLGERVPNGVELTRKAEEAISKHYDEPFWIVNYPSSVRGFHYLRDPSNPSVNKDFNLILPLGYGEVIDGGEREYRYEEIVARIKSLGEKLSKYSWFLEALKIGIAPSAGFGLGIERLTRYLLGLKYIWEATPFPKPPGVTGAP